MSVAACSKDERPTYKENPVSALYNRAVNAMEAGEYIAAAQFFEEVDRQHPYSAWATKAQLMSAYSNYKGNKYDEAVIGLNRFIRLHPGNRDTPYAYYLKALVYYDGIADISRNQLGTERALKALRELIRRYPQSKYSRDARLKIDLTRDHLAGKEMAIGRFYLRRKEYLAAINRFRLVIKNYETTTHTPEALHRMVEAYSAIGMRDEAIKAASVLGHNYPGNEWYTDSYILMTGINTRAKNKTDDVFTRVWKWVF